MTEKPISRFSAPPLEDAPQDVRERIEAVQEKAKFAPNVFLALSRRPEEFRAFMAYHDALMDRPSGLTMAEKEMIIVATSAANRCPYCVVAHGAILKTIFAHYSDVPLNDIWTAPSLHNCCHNIIEVDADGSRRVTQKAGEPTEGTVWAGKHG